MNSDVLKEIKYSACLCLCVKINKDTDNNIDLKLEMLAKDATLYFFDGLDQLPLKGYEIYLILAFCPSFVDFFCVTICSKKSS